LFSGKKERKRRLTESDLIINQNLRNDCINHFEVLGKVKQLLLIPGTELMTVQQVADYYEVGKEAIQSLYKDYKEELDSDGTRLEGYKDFLNVLKGQLKIGQGKTTVLFNDGNIIEVPRRGLKVFPRRAILRVGMLLRDSEVAKEVRTQLLNIEEKAAPEVKTEDLNEEMKLALSLGMAQASGNAEAYQKAVTAMMAFKNRHIQKLEADNGKLAEDNKALAAGNLEWSDRSEINFAIRKLSGVSGVRVQDLWSTLYQQLLYKHHINVKARGKQPWIQHVKENEWQAVSMVFASMCVAYGTTASDILDQLKVK
jgi:hypothetical protein